MGFYCPHIAMDLLKTDEELYIYGPAVMNSEVLVSKLPLEDIKTVGYSKNRAYLFDKMKKIYPFIKKGEEVNKGIGYFIETEEIDSGIVGITEANNFKGYNVYPISNEDYISYVLVVRKGVEVTTEFEDFIDAYNSFYKTHENNLQQLVGMEEIFELKILDLGGLDGN